MIKYKDPKLSLYLGSQTYSCSNDQPSTNKKDSVAKDFKVLIWLLIILSYFVNQHIILFVGGPKTLKKMTLKNYFN